MTRLIVLPFRMLRPDPEIDFLSFSLADAITASLGRLTSLVVRSSRSPPASRPRRLGRVATELDVNAAVTDATPRRQRVRVATQLVEAPGGRLLWSRTTQVTLNDIFQLQDDFTHQIVESLSLPLSTREERLLSRDAPANARSYEYFLRANELAPDERAGPSHATCTNRPCRRIRGTRPRGPGRPCPPPDRQARRGSSNELAGAEAALTQALELNPDLPLAPA